MDGAEATPGCVNHSHSFRLVVTGSSIENGVPPDGDARMSLMRGNGYVLVRAAWLSVTLYSPLIVGLTRP